MKLRMENMENVENNLKTQINIDFKGFQSRNQKNINKQKQNMMKVENVKFIRKLCKCERG